MSSRRVTGAIAPAAARPGLPSFESVAEREVERRQPPVRGFLDEEAVSRHHRTATTAIGKAIAEEPA